MTLDAEKPHLMLPHQRQQFFPELLILHRLFGSVAPMVLFPGNIPFFAETICDIGAVCEYLDFLIRLFERFERLDDRGQLHAVVGRVGLPAEELLLMLPIFEDCAPAADILIGLVAGTGTVRINS